MDTKKLLTSLKKKINLKSLYLSLLIVGPILVFAGLFLLFYERAVLSFNKTPSASVISTKPLPVRIIISDLEMDLPITEGRIVSGIWEISGSGASHLDISARPGESGNIVIYGHNKKKIFGSLLYIRKGSFIKIEAADGTKRVYQVTEKVTVKPDNLDYVLAKGEETLTVYTCNGFLDSTRLIVVAKPI